MDSICRQIICAAGTTDAHLAVRPLAPASALRRTMRIVQIIDHSDRYRRFATLFLLAANIYVDGIRGTMTFSSEEFECRYGQKEDAHSWSGRFADAIADSI